MGFKVFRDLEHQFVGFRELGLILLELGTEVLGLRVVCFDGTQELFFTDSEFLADLKILKLQTVKHVQLEVIRARAEQVLQLRLNHWEIQLHSVDARSQLTNIDTLVDLTRLHAFKHG